MQEKFGLPQDNIEALKQVFSKYKNIKKITLYGSRSMGNFKTGSDIDLTLLAPEMNLTEFLKLENEIDDLMLPYKVDLSLHHHIDNKALLEHIEKHGVDF